MDTKKLIYVDNAATTRVYPSVVEKMVPYLTEIYGNPSSQFYALGREARAALEKARSGIAQMLGCEPREIFFTSGGTESNNAAIFGIARSNTRIGKHILTTEIEHPSVLETMKQLESQLVKRHYKGFMK